MKIEPLFCFTTAEKKQDHQTSIQESADPLGKGSQAGAMPTLSTPPAKYSKTKYNLEGRTFHFAQNVRLFTEKFPKQYWRRNDLQQLIRAAGSVAANYIEANESMGKKDFRLRLRICLKEAKESRLWLGLLSGLSERLEEERKALLDESYQLVRIFSAGVRTLAAKEKPALAK